MIEKGYTRSANKLLAGKACLKHPIIIRFDKGIVKVIRASQHRLPRACVWRKFWRMKKYVKLALS